MKTGAEFKIVIDLFMEWATGTVEELESYPQNEYREGVIYGMKSCIDYIQLCNSMNPPEGEE